jgi:hypothetical protein
LFCEDSVRFSLEARNFIGDAICVTRCGLWCLRLCLCLWLWLRFLFWLLLLVAIGLVVLVLSGGLVCAAGWWFLRWYQVFLIVFRVVLVVVTLDMDLAWRLWRTRTGALSILVPGNLIGWLIDPGRRFQRRISGLVQGSL